MDNRLEEVKIKSRAMQSYVYMLHEFILEAKWKNVLEIGVQKGYSTLSMLLAISQNKFGKLVSIDDLDRHRLLTKWKTYNIDLPKYWHFIQGDSHNPNTLKLAKETLCEGEMFDMLFIDGDHTYNGVKKDFKMYGDLVKPGGVIMMHDVTNIRAGVKEFWKEIKWDKFDIDWGKSKNKIIPGMGLVKKPKN